ncbi:MAG: leucine-rich repeat domain-containing protein [Planctomycetaceae bacterium]|nr:leucine-rich repeat domain-containing protein [Planctomycetaceae bacterium]
MADFEYTVHDDRIEITSYTGSAPSVTIPSTIDGLPVTDIEKGAFVSCESLMSVMIPESVTSIGNKAFYYCDSLTSVTIPDSVTCIGDGAFYECRRLTIYGTEGSAAQTYAKRNKISFSTDPSPYCDAAGVCYSHDGKTLLGAPLSLSGEYTIPDGVTSIGKEAFEDCKKLMAVTIPESVTSIGNRAFFSCHSLTAVTIPKSVTSIGWEVFENYRRLTIYGTKGSAAQTYAKDNEIPFSTDPSPYCNADGVYYSHDGQTLLGAPWSLSGEYKIPDSVTSIGGWAFCCSGLTSLTIPDRVMSIGEGAFCECRDLTSVTISNRLTRIEEYVFAGCSRLTSVTIPESVTSIGYKTFYSCDSLTSVTIPESVTSISFDAFDDCHDDLVIYGKAGSKAEWHAKENRIGFKVE